MRDSCVDGTGQVVIQCPGCMDLQAVPTRYDEIGELYAHMTGHECFSDADAKRECGR